MSVSFTPPVDRAITVRLRSRDDYLPPIRDGLLARLREIGGVVNFGEMSDKVSENPMAVVIRLGNIQQLEAVREVALWWVEQELAPEETHERVAVLMSPNLKVISFVWLEEDWLGEHIELDPEDARVPR